MNNLSKFMIKQQSLKFLKIYHTAELVFFNNWDGIDEDNPSKLKEKALSDFLSSLIKCASASLEVLSLHNF